MVTKKSERKKIKRGTRRLKNLQIGFIKHFIESEKIDRWGKRERERERAAIRTLEYSLAHVWDKFSYLQSLHLIQCVPCLNLFPLLLGHSLFIHFEQKKKDNKIK